MKTPKERAANPGPSIAQVDNGGHSTAQANSCGYRIAQVNNVHREISSSPCEPPFSLWFGNGSQFGGNSYVTMSL